MAKIDNFTTLIVQTVTATIQNGQTESDMIDMRGATIKTIIMPAAFTGSEITFKISPDGVTFYDYYNIDNLKVSITCSPSRAYGLGAIDFYSIQYLKIVSNAAEVAERSIQLLTRGI